MAEGNTPRFGAYDPEADLIDAYGELPIVPTFVDPTAFGLSGRNPGFAIAADNPGVPVILPTTVPTNPHRYLKGVRYDGGGYGDFVPTFENRNPMAPNVPEGVSFSDEKGMDPALIGAMLGGMGKAPSIPSRMSQQRQAADAVRGARAASAEGERRLRATQIEARDAQRQLQNVREGRMAEGQMGMGRDARGVIDPSDAFYTNPAFPGGGEAVYTRRRGLPLGFGLREPLKQKPLESIHELRMGRAKLSPRPYLPRSTKDGDYRFEEIVTRETPVMVPQPGREYTPNPYQSEVDFRFGQTKPTRAPVPLGDRSRSSRGYGKQYVQEGAVRGGYDDDVFEAYKAAEELALSQNQRAAARSKLLDTRVSDAIKDQQLVGDTILAGPLMASLAGAAAGEAYDETFGEGDTRYMDPSGEQRMAARQAGAKMPASASRQIKKVLEDRELYLGSQASPLASEFRKIDDVPIAPLDASQYLVRDVNQTPRMYRELGQELPAVGPLFAFDPYQGY